MNPTPISSDLPLTTSQVAEVMARSGEIAAAGMPLATGLVAAAAEADSPGVARVLRRVAEELNRGRPLAEVLAASRAPGHLAGVLAAAQRTGHFGAVLNEWTENRRAARQHWRAVVASLSYPLLVLALTVGLFVLFLVFLVRPFRAMYTEFDLPLPAMTESLFRLADQGVTGFLAVALCLAVVVAGLRLTSGRAGWSWLVTNVPVIGPIWHWTGAAEMLRSLSLLIEHQVPLPEALRLTAGGISDAHIADQCLALAKRVEQGSTLWGALVDLRTLPLSIVPLVHWGEQHATLSEALHTAAEMLEGRLRLRSGLLTVILPPAMFILVGTIASSMIALVIPMITLIQGLS